MADPLVKSLRSFLQTSAAPERYNEHGKVVRPNMILRAEYSKSKGRGGGGIAVDIMLPPSTNKELLYKTAKQMVHWIEGNQPTPPFVRVGKARVVLKPTSDTGQTEIDNSVAKKHRLSKSDSLVMDKAKLKDLKDQDESTAKSPEIQYLKDEMLELKNESETLHTNIDEVVAKLDAVNKKEAGDSDDDEGDAALKKMGMAVMEEHVAVHNMTKAQIDAAKAEHDKVLQVKFKARKARLRKKKGLKSEDEEAWDQLVEKHKKEEEELEFDCEVERAYSVHTAMTRFWRTAMGHERSTHAQKKRRRKKPSRQLSTIKPAAKRDSDDSAESGSSSGSSSSGSEGEGEGEVDHAEARVGDPTAEVAAGDDEDPDDGDEEQEERDDPLADSDGETTGDVDARKRRMADAVRRAHADKTRYVDLREIAWKPEGRSADPVPLNALNAQQFLAYGAGATVMSGLRRQLHFLPTDVVITRSLQACGFTHPTPTDVILLEHCPFTRSFLYDADHDELYIRMERLDSLGGYITTIIHIMAVLKVRATMMREEMATVAADEGSIVAALNYTLAAGFGAVCGTLLGSRSFGLVSSQDHSNKQLKEGFVEQLVKCGFDTETDVSRRNEMISTLVHLGHISLTMSVEKTNLQMNADLEALLEEENRLGRQLDQMKDNSATTPEVIDLHRHKLNLSHLKVWIAQQCCDQMMGLKTADDYYGAEPTSSTDSAENQLKGMVGFLERHRALPEGEAYIDPFDSELNQQGAAPVNIAAAELSPARYMVYALGITVMELMANQIDFPVLRKVHVATSLPEFDAELEHHYNDNPYRRSFYFDEKKEELHVRVERLDTASGYIMMLLNVLAHLKAPPYLKCEFGESASTEHGQAFRREFYRSLRILFADITAFRLLLNSAHGYETRERFADMMDANGFQKAAPKFHYFNSLLSQDSRLEHVRQFAEQAAEIHLAQGRQELRRKHAQDMEGFLSERDERKAAEARAAGDDYVSELQHVTVLQKLEADKLDADTAMFNHKSEMQKTLETKLVQRTGKGYKGMNEGVHSSIQMTLVKTEMEANLAQNESRMRDLKLQLQEAEIRTNKSLQVRGDLISQLEQSLVRLEHLKICLCLFEMVEHTDKNIDVVTFDSIEVFLHQIWSTEGLHIAAPGASPAKSPRDTPWMKSVYAYMDKLEEKDAKARAKLAEEDASSDGRKGAAQPAPAINSIGDFIKFQQAFSGKSASRVCTMHLFAEVGKAHKKSIKKLNNEMSVKWLRNFLCSSNVGLDLADDVRLRELATYLDQMACTETTGDKTVIDYLKFQAAVASCLSLVYLAVVAGLKSRMTKNKATKTRNKECDNTIGSMRAELDWLYRSMHAQHHTVLWDGTETLKRKSLRVMTKEPICKKATKGGGSGMIACIDNGCKLMHVWQCEVKLGATSYLGVSEARKHKKGANRLDSMVRVHGHIAAVHPSPDNTGKIESVSVVVTMKDCLGTKTVDHFECAPTTGATKGIKLRPSVKNGHHLPELIRKYGTDNLRGVLENRIKGLVIQLTVPLSHVLPAVTHPSFVYTVGTRILVKGQPGTPYNGYCATVIGVRKYSKPSKKSRFSGGEKDGLVNEILPVDGKHATYINTDKLVFWFDNLGQVPSNEGADRAEPFIPKPSNHILSTPFSDYQKHDQIVIYLPPDEKAPGGTLAVTARADEADGVGEAGEALNGVAEALQLSAHQMRAGPDVGRWVLGSVIERTNHSRYKIQLLDDTKTADGVVEQDLNEVNHFNNSLIIVDYKDELAFYLEEIKGNSTVVDGITGMKLDIGKQTVEVDLEDKKNEDFRDVKNVSDLCDRLATNKGQ